MLTVSKISVWFFFLRFPTHDSCLNECGPLQTAAPQHCTADGDIRGSRTRVPHHRVVSTQTTNATTENGRWWSGYWSRRRAFKWILMISWCWDGIGHKPSREDSELTCWPVDGCESFCFRVMVTVVGIFTVLLAMTLWNACKNNDVARIEVKLPLPPLRYINITHYFPPQRRCSSCRTLLKGGVGVAPLVLRLWKGNLDSKMKRSPQGRVASFRDKDILKTSQDSLEPGVLVNWQATVPCYCHNLSLTNQTFTVNLSWRSFVDSHYLFFCIPG